MDKLLENIENEIIENDILVQFLTEQKSIMNKLLEIYNGKMTCFKLNPFISQSTYMS